MVRIQIVNRNEKRMLKNYGAKVIFKPKVRITMFDLIGELQDEAAGATVSFDKFRKIQGMHNKIMVPEQVCGRHI